MTKSYNVKLDPARLAAMRKDLDSDPQVWVVPPSGGISKEQAIGRYLNELLTALGEAGKCPTCGRPL